ncbi:MAG TPA: hypothetical protein VFG78_09060 [Gemmatimonadota bacterium]|nr:hypothetical protein [Gemmatimonadota bacterium]
MLVVGRPEPQPEALEDRQVTVELALDVEPALIHVDPDGRLSLRVLVGSRDAVLVVVAADREPQIAALPDQR